VDAARQKVLAACPDCAAAADAAGKKPLRHDANENEPGTRPEPVEEQERIEAKRETRADAPPAEEARGGCASCATIGSARAAIDPGWGLLLGGALLALRRRRLSSSCRASDRA